MLSPGLLELLNEQINKELYSAYLYLSISNFYDDVTLDGFKSWFYVQTQEERDHALLIRAYIMENDEKVVLGPLKGPDAEYADFAAPLRAALEHERYITSSINQIYAAAHAEKDFRTMQFLDWFVKEQLEEEKSVQTLIDKYALFATDGRGLYLLDQELAARVYTPPSLVIGG